MSRYSTLACAALATLFCVTSQAAIIRPLTSAGNPPPSIAGNIAQYLQVDQTKPSNTAVEILADDLPSDWVGSGGASSRYWVKRTTPRMLMWAIDRIAANEHDVSYIQTQDWIDLTPFAALPSLTIDVHAATKSRGVTSRPYTINGVDQTFTYGEPVPEPAGVLLALVAVGGLSRIARDRPTKKPRRQR